MVYDLTTQKFRNLDPSNFDDDLTIGLIFLDKNALKVLKQTFLICGYLLINKNSKLYFPIDIREEGITIFEGVYNSFSKNIQKQLEKFISNIKPSSMFTRFFIEWQFDNNAYCFSTNGSFIKLCSSCIEHNELIARLIEYDCHLICPETYEELCDATSKLKKIFNFTVYNKNYNDSFKYIVDSLINNYYIRFSELEIVQIFYNICTICNETVSEVE